MSNLKTVPLFTFTQGDIFEGGSPPIHVSYYENTNLIELSQEGHYASGERIMIKKELFMNLVEEIKKHLSEITHPETAVIDNARELFDKLMMRYNDTRYSWQRRSCYYDLAKDIMNDYNLETKLAIENHQK